MIASESVNATGSWCLQATD